MHAFNIPLRTAVPLKCAYVAWDKDVLEALGMRFMLLECMQHLMLLHALMLQTVLLHRVMTGFDFLGESAGPGV